MPKSYLQLIVINFDLQSQRLYDFPTGKISFIETRTPKIKKKKKKQRKAHGLKMLIRSQSKNIQNSIEGNNYVIIFETVT